MPQGRGRNPRVQHTKAPIERAQSLLVKYGELMVEGDAGTLTSRSAAGGHGIIFRHETIAK